MKSVNLVVRDAFAAKYSRVVLRVVKENSVMYTKLVWDLKCVDWVELVACVLCKAISAQAKRACNSLACNSESGNETAMQ